MSIPVDDSLLPRPLDDPEIERPREELWKDGQQVKTHNRWLVVGGWWSVSSDYHQPPTTNHPFTIPATLQAD